jgi:hypothetical protein
VVQTLAEAQKRLVEVQKDTGERLSALIGVVNGIVRRTPPAS